MGTLSDAKQVDTASVRGAARADRFPKYDPSQGWEPRREFFGVPVPKEEFSTGNVANEFHQNMEGCVQPRLTARFKYSNYRGITNWNESMCNSEIQWSI